jgi:hypothetical protein
MQAIAAAHGGGSERAMARGKQRHLTAQNCAEGDRLKNQPVEFGVQRRPGNVANDGLSVHF